MNWLKRFWCDYWLGIVLITFLALFFGKIALNGIKYSEYREKFATECARKGGVVFIPRGVKGWPRPECLKPEVMINIDL